MTPRARAAPAARRHRPCADERGGRAAGGGPDDDAVERRHARGDGVESDDGVRGAGRAGRQCEGGSVSASATRFPAASSGACDARRRGTLRKYRVHDIAHASARDAGQISCRSRPCSVQPDTIVRAGSPARATAKRMRTTRVPRCSPARRPRRGAPTPSTGAHQPIVEIVSCQACVWTRTRISGRPVSAPGDARRRTR
jgi:hypothetical protein